MEARNGPVEWQKRLPRLVDAPSTVCVFRRSRGPTFWSKFFVFPVSLDSSYPLRKPPK
ncbi:hypothetical protein PtA15_15A245 [Puccinia triticina]|uniref:Uncharacterized protein n=1 Tax=Puccinia triticina TaxID=208348 RepID=A0ABY7D2L0_9BASI|nr:uncharacterized protein PtA15_15A245 [Puccinia triticina]WAQ91853.1 hypothetical protein PtA15_15A245 [Puccinia triticina]